MHRPLDAAVNTPHRTANALLHTLSAATHEGGSVAQRFGL